MKRLIAGIMLGACVWLLAQGEAHTQPPGKGEKKGGGKFGLGTVIPPHLRPDLNLTEDQARKIADLERRVREELSKILTDEQKRKIEEAGPPPKKDGPPKEKDKEKETPPKKGDPRANAGIQWFATWEAGLAEAQRTQKPILLVSAAPHCAGVSGIW